MSRTNQGIFLLLTKEFESLDSEYRNAITQYFGNGRWNCDCDFISEFAYSADAIFKQACDLENLIHGVLKSNKLESDKIKQKYENMQKRCQQIRYDMKNKFNEVLSIKKMSGGYISDIEQRTLDKLSIYKHF